MKGKYEPIHKNENHDEENSNYHGFNYLLSMPIWNLTMEKVENLLKEKADKESQVKTLINQVSFCLFRL